MLPLNIENKYTTTWYTTLGDLKQKYIIIHDDVNNRISDKLRVPKIRKFMKNKTKLPDELCGFDTQDGKLLIYDGGHRYESIKDIDNIEMIIKITTDQETRADDIKTKGDRNPMPRDLLEGNVDNKKDIDFIVEKMCDSYPSFAKISAKPRKPHFNKTIVYDIVSGIYKTQKENPDTVYDILINQINDDAKIMAHQEEHHKKIKILEKCDKTNFYLFYLSPEEITKKTVKLIEGAREEAN